MASSMKGRDKSQRYSRKLAGGGDGGSGKTMLMRRMVMREGRSLARCAAPRM